MAFRCCRVATRSGRSGGGLSERRLAIYGRRAILERTQPIPAESSGRTLTERSFRSARGAALTGWRDGRNRVGSRREIGLETNRKLRCSARTPHEECAFASLEA